MVAKKRKPIRIKKENRGKFTAWAKKKGMAKKRGKGVTSKAIQAGLKSKSAAVRKRANFARNARKWKKK